MITNHPPKKITSTPTILQRALPACLAVAPISMMFGVLASKANWNTWEILACSALGFSGSGQFALLPLANQGLDFLTMLLVALSINCRYIAIAFITSNRLPKRTASRAFMAHIVGDEAYALEHEKDSISNVFWIRIIIYITWIVSGGLGALIGKTLPEAWFSSNVNFGFPASMVLLGLSLLQLKQRIPKLSTRFRSKAMEITLCVIFTVLFLSILGQMWFWIPSIIFSTWRLWTIRQ